MSFTEPPLCTASTTTHPNNIDKVYPASVAAAVLWAQVSPQAWVNMFYTDKDISRGCKLLLFLLLFALLKVVALP